ncbi:MAG TPA: YggS family pyridoxal phosphate-dependent enzyme [Clostridiales bacterium UBA8153]|nr:YggS family pyridoxal phosphate-dependent enzyme [Clostridiales bacterium UBA8153]
MTTTVAENLKVLRERIAQAAHRSGRGLDDITLVAVTKQVPVERIREAVEQGVTHLGENRVQEAREKVPQVTGVTWHMIGYLQTNKARPALEMFQLIHSLDRPTLLEVLSAQARKLDQVVRVLVQVNTSGEATKSGVDPHRAMELVVQAQATPYVLVEGLMTIGPATGGPAAARPGFAALRRLAERLEAERLPGVSMRYLSMGMSADFEVAIAEGANLVRVGSAIFGPRPG